MKAFRRCTLAFFLFAACGGSPFTTASDGSSAAGGAGGADGSPRESGGRGGASEDGPGGAGGAAAGDAAPRDASPEASPPKNSGDCDTAAQCGGDPCKPLTPGGYRVCTTPVSDATACSDVASDQCCTTDDCGKNGSPKGRCYQGPIEPSCAGPVMVPGNVCALDACSNDADCAGAFDVCVPAGALGRKLRRCLPGGCRRDTDCTDEAGGICAPILGSCCGEVVALACVYHGGCRSKGDCKASESCAIDARHAFCMAGGAVCPL